MLVKLVQEHIYLHDLCVNVSTEITFILSICFLKL